MYSRL